jgi:hypothetical protein
MFSGVNLSMAPSETLPGGTGSHKSKMAAEEMKLNVSQLLFPIATKLYGYTHVFRLYQRD